MDLGAYIQIGDLETIAKENEISVPRLRGYRLMSQEASISSEEITKAMREHECTIYEWAVVSVPRFHPFSNMHEYSWETDKIAKKFLIKKTMTDTMIDGSSYQYEKTVGFRWNLLHGKNRKVLKYAIKVGYRDVRKKFDTFNKYVGRDDVLLIHARIGGNNWAYYGGADIEKQPWFLEKVDDYFDSTYCDIYAKIPPFVKKND